MIRHLYRYPVKGLSGEPCQSLQLETGRGIPLDRSIALARRPGLFDPAAPVALTKNNFLMLMRDERLASLRSRYHDGSRQLEITASDGKYIFDLGDIQGCLSLAAFLRPFTDDARAEPIVVEAAGHQFTDISVVSTEKMHAVSLINLASVGALADATGQEVDHRRFRANLYFTGGVPWEEFDWLDREIRVGNTRLRVTMRTRRCAATQVNPDTATRDLNVPAELKRHFGHFDMGVYAEVIEGGDVSIDDMVVA